MMKLDKTKLYISDIQKRKLCQFRFTCRETPIQYTECYKYLGVEFTEYFSWAKSLENTAISINKAASYLIAKTRSSSAFLFTTYSYLYTYYPRVTCLIQQLYLGLRPFDQISKIQNNLMSRFLGVERNVPIVTLLEDGVGTYLNNHKGVMYQIMAETKHDKSIKNY